MIEARATTGGPRQTLAVFAAELLKNRPVLLATPPGPLVDLFARLAPRADIKLLPEWSEDRLRAVRQAQPLLRALIGKIVRGQGIIHTSTESAFKLALPALLRARPKPPVLVHFHDSTPLRATTVTQIHLSRAGGV